MNSVQINSCMKPVKNYIGTFPCDMLPEIPKTKRPCSIIGNTDKSGNPGKHWVAFYLTKDHIEVYDTYGRGLLPEFRKFVGKQKYVCNTKQVQTFDSSVCGQHCIYYIYKRNEGKSMQDIVSRFKTPQENDLFVKNWARLKFGGRVCLKGIKGDVQYQNCQSYFCACQNESSPFVCQEICVPKTWIQEKKKKEKKSQAQTETKRYQDYHSE